MRGGPVPFTASHPAAVLPLVGTGLVPSALVIGSMVPDVPLFAPGPVSYAATHSPAGVVGLDVVIGLLAYVVWHAFLVAPAVALAPAEVRARLPRRHGRPGTAAIAVRRLAM